MTYPSSDQPCEPTCEGCDNPIGADVFFQDAVWHSDCLHAYLRDYEQWRSSVVSMTTEEIIELVEKLDEESFKKWRNAK